MPIVHMTDKPVMPEGAKNLRGHCHVINREVSADVIGPCLYWTYETHHGLCIHEQEQNGYHDSDFYMIVWSDVTNSPHRLFFATTRGWSYPCYASRPDATPETIVKYQAWQNEQVRLARIENRRAQANCIRKVRNDLRAHFGDDFLKAMKLMKVTGPNYIAKLIKLMNKRARGNFTKSMQAQVKAWFADPSPKYPTPLSGKQIESIY